MYETLNLFCYSIIFCFLEHPLYPAISKFITVKPFLDIAQVPEYFKLFNSIDIEVSYFFLHFIKLGGNINTFSIHANILFKILPYVYSYHYIFFFLAPNSKTVVTKPYRRWLTNICRLPYLWKTIYIQYAAALLLHLFGNNWRKG